MPYGVVFAPDRRCYEWNCEISFVEEQKVSSPIKNFEDPISCNKTVHPIIFE
jgi:hypothetical protein